MSHPVPQKKPVEVVDWHPADVIAALRKVGWSLRQLSLDNGLDGKTVAHALHKPYPKAERIIADALGVRPEAIWPSRYDSRGVPNRTRGRKPLRPESALTAR